jgi:hypothetical protein
VFCLPIPLFQSGAAAFSLLHRMHVVRKAAVPVTWKAILGSNFEPHQGQFPSQTPHNVVNRYLDLIEAIPASNTEYHLLKPSCQSEVEICGNKAIDTATW